MTTTTTYRLDLPRWDAHWETKTRRGLVVIDKRTRKPVKHRKIWDALTGNARTAHWSQRSKAVAEVIEAVGWLARAAKLTTCSHLTVQLAWAPGDNRRADAPNLATLQKPCVDSLVRLGIVPDDTAEWVTELMPRIDRPPAPAGLWLELEVRA